MTARPHHKEYGQAMILVLAFMLLAVPLVTSALGLASTLSIDSRSKTRILMSQYSAIGARQYSLYWLQNTTTDATTTIDINGTEVTIYIRQVPPPPDLPAYLSSSFGRYTMAVEKQANVTTTTPGGTVSYTVSIQNRDQDQPTTIKYIHDVLPMDFSYVAGTSVFTNHSSTVLSTDDPGTDPWGGGLLWDVPDTTLQPGETATMTFDALVDAGVADGIYCNEAFVRTGWFGWRRTTSGKTAKVTIGSPGTTLCAGSVISLEKTVDPDLVTSETSTTFTYRLTVANEGTNDVKICRITDMTSDMYEWFEYVPGSMSSTPAGMSPGEPSNTNQNRIRWNIASCAFSGETLTSGSTWVMDFDVTATLPRGQFPNEVELRFPFFPLSKYIPPMTSWPTAVISVIDYYEVVITDGETTYTCHVWMGADTEGNDIQLVEDCSPS